jgi:hypothetical protein
MRNDNSIACAAAVAAAMALALAGCGGQPTQPMPEMPDTPAEEGGGPSTEAADAAESGEPVELQENAPLRYVVQKGDTLWSISQKFLKDSWQWPEVWYVNPKVQNPHLIYPGDELVLYFTGGQPHIAKAGETPAGAQAPGPNGQPPTETAEALPAMPAGGMGDLRPHARVQRLDQAIYSIPLGDIKQFLHGPRLIGEDELDDAPYIVDFQTDHLLAATDDIAYAMDVEKRDLTRYQVVRKGQEYRDPEDNDIIGYEVMPVAEAEIREFGEPTTIYLTRSQIEARAGDYLLPMEQEPYAPRFIPHAPDKAIDGSIVSVYNGVSLIGQYQIIVINRGTEQGMEPGHVLSIYEKGRTVEDPNSFFGRDVKLPDIKAGTAMVFKTSPRMCLALIMSGTRAIHVGDRVERPEPSR